MTAGSTFIASVQSKPAGGIPKRILGRTGESVAIIGLGGWTIGKVEEAEAINIMHRAIDEGVTFFDNCWHYNNGWSEEVMGKALKGSSRRDKVYLMSKGCGRDAENCDEHINTSLKQLDVDHLDLWMFHGVAYMEEVPRIFDEKKGALNAVLKAQKAGKIRHIGFSCHTSADIALAMLKSGLQFDAALIPTSILDAHYDSFQMKVIPECREQNVGILGMKSLNVGNIPSLGFDAVKARRYALSLPISSLMCGIESWDNYHQDYAMAKHFEPLSEREVTNLLAESEPYGKDGSKERYKSGNAGCHWQRNEDRKAS